MMGAYLPHRPTSKSRRILLFLGRLLYPSLCIPPTTTTARLRANKRCKISILRCHYLVIHISIKSLFIGRRIFRPRWYTKLHHKILLKSDAKPKKNAAVFLSSPILLYMTRSPDVEMRLDLLHQTYCQENAFQITTVAFWTTGPDCGLT